jgi:hypothetical protein
MDIKRSSAVPHTAMYCGHLTEIIRSIADDLFTTDGKIIVLIAERQFRIIILSVLQEHYCWLNMKCLFEHLINVLSNVNQKIYSR